MLRFKEEEEEEEEEEQQLPYRLEIYGKVASADLRADDLLGVEVRERQLVLQTRSGQVTIREHAVEEGEAS
jgi:hypothetical protein